MAKSHLERFDADEKCDRHADASDQADDHLAGAVALDP